MSRHEDMHGPTPREARMIELDEAGWTVAEIADLMDLKQDYVLQRLKGLSMNDTSADKAFFDMSVRGTSMLASAVNAAGGHR